MKKINLFFLIFFISTSVLSEVKIESKCFGNQSKNAPYSYFGVILTSYFDVELGREVGAFVKYSNKNFIPLVFDKRIETDVENPDLGNYELQRLEISEGKVTGSYIFVQTGAGNKQGSFLKYKNLKTKNVYTLFNMGTIDSCVESCVGNKCRFITNSR